MDLREEIGAKVEIINANIAAEKDLLPQGDTVPKDAQDYKDELERIRKYVEDLYTRASKECDNFSEDVKYWAQYRHGLMKSSINCPVCEFVLIFYHFQFDQIF